MISRLQIFCSFQWPFPSFLIFIRLPKGTAICRKNRLFRRFFSVKVGGCGGNGIHGIMVPKKPPSLVSLSNKSKSASWVLRGQLQLKQCLLSWLGQTLYSKTGKRSKVQPDFQNLCIHRRKLIRRLLRIVLYYLTAAAIFRVRFTMV